MMNAFLNAGVDKGLRAALRVMMTVSAVFGLCLAMVGARCEPRATLPGVLEAAAPVEGPLCYLIEVITGANIDTLCATLPEIATLVAWVASSRAQTDAGSLDAGACQVLPTTNVCATAAELRGGFGLVLGQRRAFLTLDAGATR